MPPPTHERVRAAPRIDPRLWAAILAEVGVAMAASNAKVRNPLSGILKLFGLLCLVVGIYAGLETIGDWNEGDSATMFAVVSGGGIIVGATALFVGAKMGQDALDSIAQGLNDACTRLQPNCNTAGLHIEPFFFRPPTRCVPLCRRCGIEPARGIACAVYNHGFGSYSDPRRALLCCSAVQSIRTLRTHRTQLRAHRVPSADHCAQRGRRRHRGQTRQHAEVLADYSATGCVMGFLRSGWWWPGGIRLSARVCS